MNRDIAMKILGVLPDEMLMKALSVVTQSGGDDANGADFMSALDTTSGDNGITPWSQKTVNYAGGKDRPPMVDKEWAKPDMNAQMPLGADGMGADGNEFLQSGGGV